ncbi:MAG: tRNA (adenosine(37)-N6)-dimethylallyltransferase MiaA [Lachnospiraceae bacterium]
MKRPLVILTGPTAVGKTQLSIRLAKECNGEIISADSMQVYRHMDIGTAKITPEEMQGVPHHLIDILEPDEEFHVQSFQTLAKSAMEKIYAKGRIPIIVGGTGFYIQALLYDISFSEEEVDQDYRIELQQLCLEHGNQYLHEKLEQVDPVSAKRIHANNSKRVIRALEFYHTTGKPISAHNDEEAQKESPYQFAYFVLNQNRETLYERIDRRVDMMMENGLLDEVQYLQKQHYDSKLPSMQGLGYKEVFAYLKGEYNLDEAIRILKRDTRHFAKRQLTWFHREKEVIWLQKDDYPTEEQQLDFIKRILREKSIIA